MSRSILAKFCPQLIDDSAFIAPGATIRGDVRIGPQSSVWFGAVVRGDTERVEIGQRSNIQDVAVLHSDPGFPCSIGDDVTIGHAAVVHGATVENGSMIGIRAVVLNGATIGNGSLVAAGALVTEGMEVPENSLVMGIPAKVVRTLTDADRDRMQHASQHYVAAAKEYQK